MVFSREMYKIPCIFLNAKIDTQKSPNLIQLQIHCVMYLLTYLYCLFSILNYVYIHIQKIQGLGSRAFQFNQSDIQIINHHQIINTNIYFLQFFLLINVPYHLLFPHGINYDLHDIYTSLELQGSTDVSSQQANNGKIVQ